MDISLKVQVRTLARPGMKMGKVGFMRVIKVEWEVSHREFGLGS